MPLRDAINRGVLPGPRILSSLGQISNQKWTTDQIREQIRKLKGEGADPIASSPADFAAFVRTEIKKWDEVGKAANIQPTE